MNSTSISLAFTLLLAFCLSSCGTSSSSGGGQVINYPTVDEMAGYESQWGMQTRQVKPRQHQADPGESFAPSAPAPVPQPSAAAPAPLKELPSEQPAAPAVPSQLR